MSWDLNWENYSKFENIKLDSNAMTYFIRFKDKKTLEEIKDGFESNFLEIIPEYDGLSTPFRYEITKDKKKIADMREDREYITINCFDNQVRSITLKIIKSLTRQVKDFVEMSHDEEKFEIPWHGLKVISHTGFAQDEEGYDILPKTFYKFYKDGDIVGKMLLEYHNLEMDECAPTIMMIEISDKYKGQGYGKVALKTIECRLKKRGFRKIWSSDTQSEWFWKKMRYHFDIDEAYRDLSRIKCP